MNIEKVYPINNDRLAQIKEVAQSTEPYTWSNYDILSLIRRLDKTEGTLVSFWEVIRQTHDTLCECSENGLAGECPHSLIITKLGKYFNE